MRFNARWQPGQIFSRVATVESVRRANSTVATRLPDLFSPPPPALKPPATPKSRHAAGEPHNASTVSHKNTGNDKVGNLSYQPRSTT